MFISISLLIGLVLLSIYTRHTFLKRCHVAMFSFYISSAFDILTLL